MLAKVKLLRYFIGLLSLIIPSCAVIPVPIPHIDTTVPSIEGHITESGMPVANRTIIYNWGRDETGWRYTAETTTSSDGYFSFPRKTRLHLIEFLVVVADCEYKYRLAMKDSEGERPLAVGFFFGPCYDMPKHIATNCELTKSGKDCCEFSDTPPWSNYIGYRVPWE
jgi:hypothetical protein